MAGARGSARRELVARLFGTRNRRRAAVSGGPSSRRAWLLLGLPALGLPVLGAFLWPHVRDAIRRHPYFAVTEVVIHETRRLPVDEVRAAAGIAPGMSVWDVDPALAEARLRAHPWIRAASVKRELPRRVTIQVREERPVAIVIVEREKGGEYYVSAHGRIFARVKSGEVRDLPYVTGLRGASLTEGDPASVRALRRAVALIRRSGKLEVSEVHVDRVRGLTLMPVRPAIPLELGWHDFEAKLARLPRVLALWAGRESDIATVSLLFDDEVIVRTRKRAS
jgi:cell division protein FtsQ